MTEVSRFIDAAAAPLRSRGFKGQRLTSAS
jgi:hypothetical protein